jgi:hypothetical protein
MIGKRNCALPAITSATTRNQVNYVAAAAILDWINMITIKDYVWGVLAAILACKLIPLENFESNPSGDFLPYYRRRTFHRW